MRQQVKESMTECKSL